MTFIPGRSAAAAIACLLVVGCAAVAPAPAPPLPAHATVEGAPLVKVKLANKEKGGRDREAMSAKYNLELESDESGPPTAAQILRAYEQRRAAERPGSKAAGLQPFQWQSLGPSNVGGRVRAIAFDPRAPGRMLAGTASGGVWESPDYGSTWRPNNDFLPNLSVTTIVFDALNPSNVYLGTGEASAGLVGLGAFKSTDGGATWRMLPATNVDANRDWRFVNRIAVHPTQPQVLVAALTNDNLVNGAIYRSADGGESWTRVSTLKALDIAFEPSNPANLVAGLDDGTVAYSRDGGFSWTRSAPLVAQPSGRGDSARAEIAFAASQPGTVYASVDNAKGEVWRSADSGASWTKVATPEHLSGQGDYDNAIWVDPLDASHLMVAGLDIYQSRDGGTTFAKVSTWQQAPESPHADHHALVSPPNYATNPMIFNGNDGGIYRAANARAVDANFAWANINSGLAVTQFYSGAGTTAAGGRIAGGTQDNGSLALSPGGDWRAVRGGDGGYVAIDPRSDQTMYGSYVYLAIHRSLTGGSPDSGVYICRGITEGYPPEGGNTYCGEGATKKANFIAPFILDPNSPERLLAGGASLWVTDAARLGTPAWRTIKAPSAATDNFINAIEVQAGNAANIWVGHNNGEVYRTTNGTAATPAWTRMGAATLPARRVMRIMADRDNASRAIVAFTGFVANNVWETLDGGGTWHSVTANLPSVPVFDVKRHPARGDWLYAATSVGVFTSENGGQSWSTTNEGPANIRVRELFWIDDHTLGAATYGRGMFKVAVASAGPSSYEGLWWGGPQEDGWGMSIAQSAGKLFAAIYVYDAVGRATWYTMTGGAWDAGFRTFSGALYKPSGSYFGAYDPARFAIGAAVGQMSLRFDTLDSATFDYTINGVSGSKALSRLAFGPPDATPVASYGGLWWGGEAQNGWGVTIAQQYRTLFLAWYTYDASGAPTWFSVSGGQWISASAFRGRVTRTSGAAWLGALYSPTAINRVDAGEVTLSFGDSSHATMTYTVDGVTQTKALSRFVF
jgi:hypothetical protein